MTKTGRPELPIIHNPTYSPIFYILARRVYDELMQRPIPEEIFVSDIQRRISSYKTISQPAISQLIRKMLKEGYLEWIGIKKQFNKRIYKLNMKKILSDFSDFLCDEIRDLLNNANSNQSRIIDYFTKEIRATDKQIKDYSLKKKESDEECLQIKNDLKSNPKKFKNPEKVRKQLISEKRRIAKMHTEILNTLTERNNLGKTLKKESQDRIRLFSEFLTEFDEKEVKDMLLSNKLVQRTIFYSFYHNSVSCANFDISLIKFFELLCLNFGSMTSKKAKQIDQYDDKKLTEEQKEFLQFSGLMYLYKNQKLTSTGAYLQILEDEIREIIPNYEVEQPRIMSNQ
jgi:DNA-binding transcriptional ArsR family regulator